MRPENATQQETPRRSHRLLHTTMAIAGLLMLSGILVAVLLPGRPRPSLPAVAASNSSDQAAQAAQSTGPTSRRGAASAGGQAEGEGLAQAGGQPLVMAQVPGGSPALTGSQAAAPGQSPTGGQAEAGPGGAHAGVGPAGRTGTTALPTTPGPAGVEGELPVEPTGSLPDLPEGEPSQLVVHGSRECGLVALTYDAGSGADGAAAILDTLKRHGVTATFFLTGKWAEQFPDLARRIVAEGHEVGNHSYSHPDFTTIDPEEALQQIKDGEAAIKRATGRDPRPLFREPYGAFNEAERLLVRQAGYSYSIYWEVDTLDWQFPSVETLVQRLTEKPQSGSVVLMHLNVPDSAVASDQAIPILREKGLEPTTVSNLLQCQQ